MTNIFSFLYTPYILPLVFSSLALASTMASVWRFRKRQIGRYFLFFLFLLQIWSLGFALEITATTLEGKIFWANVQFLGIVPLPLFLFQIVLLLTGQETKARQYMKVLVAPACLMLAAIWTNDIHRQFRVAPYVNCDSAPFCVLSNDYGALFYVHAAIGYALFLLAGAAAMRSLIVAKPVYRQQIRLLFVSILFPLLTDILYILGITPVANFNFTPVTFSVFSIGMAFAIFRYRLFNIKPLAYDIIVENMTDGIVIVDETGIILDVNPAARELLGLDNAQAIGHPIEILKDAHPKLFEHYLEKSAAHVMVASRRGGEDMYLEVGVSPVLYDAKRLVGYAISLRDATERVRLYQEIVQLAHTDPLTGALNRRRFFELAEREFSRSLRHGSPFAIILLDLDHFKIINDTHGHAIGDIVLKEVAYILGETAREEDIVARFGGEEFVIFLPDTDADSACQCAERLREKIFIHFARNESDIYVAASMGVAEYLQGAHLSVPDVISAADKALYQAKMRGRNRTERDTPQLTPIPVKENYL